MRNDTAEDPLQGTEYLRPHSVIPDLIRNPCSSRHSGLDPESMFIGTIWRKTFR
jgi:hypothetical protein